MSECTSEHVRLHVRIHATILFRIYVRENARIAFRKYCMSCFIRGLLCVLPLEVYQEVLSHQRTIVIPCYGMNVARCCLSEFSCLCIDALLGCGIHCEAGSKQIHQVETAMRLGMVFGVSGLLKRTTCAFSLFFAGDHLIWNCTEVYHCSDFVSTCYITPLAAKLVVTRSVPVRARTKACDFASHQNSRGSGATECDNDKSQILSSIP